MVQCPFLSTAEGEVECFEECAFYNWMETSKEGCPFKSLKGYRVSKLDELYEYDFLVEASISATEEPYEDKFGGI